MGCTAFFGQVKKHLHYLLDEYGFSVVYEEDSQSFDNCIVVLQSNDCCIRVVRDKGDVLLEIGPLSAPDVWSPGPRLWFYLGTIIAFLTQDSEAAKRVNATLDQFLEGDSKTDWQLAKLASELRPYCDQIFELFREDTFGRKQMELEKFRKKQMEEIWKQL